MVVKVAIVINQSIVVCVKSLAYAGLGDSVLKAECWDLWMSLLTGS
jgi:hypothetical protein